MPRGWPPLELRQVLEILKNLGLSYTDSKGGHDFYEGTRLGQKCKVTVDPKCAPFCVDLLKSMCSQANSNRKEFYGACKSAKAKIS
jgi:predicted RNA binding protein YcfA (HicA-like mRNA interferase family)